jgi:L-alanine-DL-glutamate epimerase-like enolase superfamily enzyme
MARAQAPITAVNVTAYSIPTDTPQSDGTLEWNATTLVLVEAEAQGVRGTGYTYADTSTAKLLRDKLVPRVTGEDAISISARWRDLRAAVRNYGQPGIASMAVSALDTALWDLKARLLDMPLVSLLGQVRETVPVYGSGGFTSYGDERLAAQFDGWRSEGLARMKMKVGREPARDLHRVEVAREAVGRDVAIFVDANGAYDRKQALNLAEQFAHLGVTWFEEPVSSADLVGLRLLRDRAPLAMEISAGEYGYTTDDFRRFLEAGAVDVLQADVTRCGGITGFLQTAALCQAWHVPLSSHCAPSLHLHVCAAALPVRHMEWFHDHVRIEQMLFEGAPQPEEGSVRPSLERPGHGLLFRHDEARRFAVE